MIDSLVYRLWLRQFVIFPVAIVLIASVSFLLGFPCAGWMWWSAMAAAMLSGVDSDRRAWLFATVCFVLSLIVLWELNRVSVTRSWVDTQVYHLPAVRALIAGWNPVKICTPEDLSSFLQLDESDARFWMMLSMPKSVWVLNAVAHFFTHDQLNLFFPAYYFLLVPVSCEIVRVFWRVGRLTMICVVLFVMVLVPRYNYIVDTVVALAGIGLLTSMWRTLSGEKPSWLLLFVFSFWMATSKQIAALHCFLFWLGFLCFWARTHSDLWRALALGCLLAITWSVSSVSPFYTNWKNYGHPLYPCYTVNPDKYPEIDLVSDFKVQNDDAASMGRIGRYSNALISSDLTQWVYAKITGRSSFHPQAQFWGYENPVDNPTSPNRTIIRGSFCGMILLVLVFGNKAARLMLLLSIVVSFAVPKLMVGYHRYTPWLLWGWLLALYFISGRWASRTFLRYGFLFACLIVLAGPYFFFLRYTASLVDLRAAANQSLVVDRCAEKCVAYAGDSSIYRGNAVLAARAYGFSKIVLDKNWDADPFYTYEFDVVGLAPYSTRRELDKMDKRDRVIRYGWFFVTSAGKLLKLLLW